MFAGTLLPTVISKGTFINHIFCEIVATEYAPSRNTCNNIGSIGSPGNNY
jgi:hypothetical protein